MSLRARNFIETQLSQAEVTIGGPNPWDVHVHNEGFYDRLLRQGSLGLGESYMDGWWDAEALHEMLYRATRSSRIQDNFPRDLSVIWSVLRGRLFNMQRLRIREVAEKHYDIGNDLYAAMLDRRMIYSCGYWKDAQNLDEAQEAKLDLVCKKLGLQPGMKVLDVGSGWGGFLQFAAERYGISGVGVTISKEQVKLANARTQGLPVETLLLDYQDLNGKFDRIVSIGMFEHVGYKNYRAFFAKARALLADDGLMILHSIGGNDTSTHGDPWGEKYIFPNGMLPSIAQIGAGIEKLFVMEDWHNFGADYDRTLMAWSANFETAWPRIKSNYDARFYRMWRYYLNISAALFRARNVGLWQIVLSPQGVLGGYSSIR